MPDPAYWLALGVFTVTSLVVAGPTALRGHDDHEPDSLGPAFTLGIVATFVLLFTPSWPAAVVTACAVTLGILVNSKTTDRLVSVVVCLSPVLAIGLAL